MVKRRLVIILTTFFIVTMAAMATLALSGCTGNVTLTDVETSTDNPVLTSNPITVYSIPDCDCCSRHMAYLEDEGFRIGASYVMYDTSLREKFPVPFEMRSCHITVIEGYFVEGHMPVEAIIKLLEEKPAIDGIVIPGMPSGSPGMPGEQAEEFIIYALSDGEISEFMTIGKY